MRRAAWFVVLALALPCADAAAKDADTVVAGELGARLDAAVEKAKSGFWGSVLVAREGDVLLAKGYGLADYDKAANTPATLFELASASKQVAAIAILHLEQKRKLTTGDTLDRFFKDVPKDKTGITVHHLLTHTSGLNSEAGVSYASPIRREAYVKRVLGMSLDSGPGERFAYSNVGYAMLAAIVEVASKTTFEGYVEKHLFKPAGMKDSGFIGDKDLIKNKRVSKRTTERPKSSAADWWYGWGYRGMGGVVTTVHDMLRWDRALRGDDILSAAAKEKMHTPALEGYAYGWRVATTDRGTKKAHHSGSVAGYGTNYVRYLEDDVVIAVLSNDPKAAHAVTLGLERELFEPVSFEAVVDAKEYDLNEHRVATLPARAKWVASKEDGRLVLRLLGGRHVALELRAPAAFGNALLAQLDTAITARRVDDAGKPAAIEAGLYLGRYDPRRSRYELSEGLTVTISPEYRGRGADGEPVVDKRVLFVLKDAKHGQWPVMAKMNVAAAEALAASIREAVE